MLLANVRLLVFAHLLWSAVLTGLALLVNIRHPYPQAAVWFRLTLILLAITTLSPLPLLWGRFSFLWIPPVTFVLASLAFLVYGFVVARAHFDHLRKGR
jgi:hypothetical protein